MKKKMNLHNISTRNKFSSGFKFLSILLLVLLVSGKSWGQSLFNASATGGAWLTAGNWTPSGVPTTTGYAQFQLNPTGTGQVGINMNNPTNNGSNNEAVGAVEATGSRAVPLVIGNSTTAAAGTFTLNGTTVNSVSNVILRNNTTQLFTIQKNIGTGTSAMTVALGNATDNIINIDGTGGITISIPISGASKNLTKAGSGTGKLTLSGVNTYSGNTSINSGKLALSGSGSIANSPIITIGSGGYFDVSGLTNALTLGSGQALNVSATGSNTSIITVATNKGLTLSSGGLVFTAYGGGATSPLTVLSSTGGALELNSAPITVTTTTALIAGTYQLVTSAGTISIAVTGTPGTLTMAGSGLAPGTSGALSVFHDQLYLTVTSSQSTDATLSAMTISAGTLAPTFTSATTSYTATVSNATSSITVTPTRNQANATIQARVNGGTYASVTSGSASGSLALNVGANTVDVKVTAQDGTTIKTYTTTVTRQSNDATLSAMSISAGALSPTFASGTNGYTATVGNGTAAVTVTPTQTSAFASIQVRVNSGTYATVTSGTASGNLSLNVGDNPIDVKVTAQDGTTIITYTVTVTRAAAAVPTISAVGTLSAVSTTYGTASSSPTSFTASGSVMNAGITVTPPAGFEVSTTSDFSSNVGDNASPITIGAAGTISNTTIYVRLKATATYAGSPYAGNITLVSTGATQVDVATASSTVTRVQLTITGLNGVNKPYDGGTTATFNGTAVYSGLVNSESFSVSGSPSASFATAAAGDGKTITIAGYTAPSTNYTLADPTVTGNITTVGLTISGISVVSRAYNATNVATLTGTAAYVGLVNSESFTVTGTPSATFADANVETAKAVSVSGYTAPSANYTVTQPTGLTGNITKANQTITGVGPTATKYMGDADYTFAASSTTSATNVLSYVSSNTAVATIDASTGLVHIVATGETTITVSQGGNSNYNAATNATQVLTVNEPEPLIDFDTAGNWTAGSVAITSYAINHTYIQNNWTFTGGNALRSTTSTQDGFAGALGTYSWRLENASGVSWTATYNAPLATNKKFTGFGFDARRWDGSPVPAYIVEYSLNGGTSWSTATSIGTSGVIDNAALNNASNWVTFNQSVSSNIGLVANKFMVRVKSTGTTERIMIDNFTYQITTLPLFTGTGEWTSNGNWNTGSAPASDAQVVIDGDITINSSVSAGNITINSGKSLTVNAGKQLTVTTGIVNNGTLLLKSDAAGTATLIDSYSAPTITATVQQHVTAGRNWYMSAPINAAGFGALNKGSVVEWNEGTKHWDDVTSGTLTPGKGYIQVAASSTGTIDFTGTTNSGPTTPVALTYNGVSQAGFNLVGNPYPSYLDWTLVNTGNTGANMTTGTMWYRTINLNSKSAWAPTTAYSLNTIVYNGTRFYKVTTAGTSAASGGPTGSGTSITDGSVVWNYEGSIYIFATVNSEGVPSPSTVSNLIPPMQAFWVKTNSGGGSFSFNNSMRSHNTGGTNALKAPKSTINDMKLLRLKVTNGSGVDESVIYSSANALNSFDKSDSPKWFNTSSNQPEIYTQVGNEKLAINAMNELSVGTEIPLGFFTEKANNFSINATEIKNFDSEMQIVLKDKLQNAEFDLTSSQAYQFSSDAMNDTNRFSIIFRSAGTTTGLTGSKLNTSTSVFINANGELVVKTSAPLSANATVSIYNAIGQQIGLQTLTSSMSIANVARTAGVYWVKLNNDGEVVTRKVVVK